MTSCTTDIPNDVDFTSRCNQKRIIFSWNEWKTFTPQKSYSKWILFRESLCTRRASFFFVCKSIIFQFYCATRQLYARINHRQKAGRPFALHFGNKIHVTQMKQKQKWKWISKRVATINLVSIYLCTDHVNISQTKEFSLRHRIVNTRKFSETKVSASLKMVEIFYALASHSDRSGWWNGRNGKYKKNCRNS